MCNSSSSPDTSGLGKIPEPKNKQYEDDPKIEIVYVEKGKTHSFFTLLKCKLFGHDWYKDMYRNGERIYHYRKCQRCGKMQKKLFGIHNEYGLSVMSGSSDWTDIDYSWFADKTRLYGHGWR